MNPSTKEAMGLPRTANHRSRHVAAELRARNRVGSTLQPPEDRAAGLDCLAGSPDVIIVDISQQLEARAREFERFGALVNGAALCRALVQDLTQLQHARHNRVLSLAEASEISGYSQAHLARLVKQGKLRSLRPMGSRGRLTFSKADLPRKPGPHHTSGAGVHDLASRLGIRGKGGRNGQA